MADARPRQPLLQLLDDSQPLIEVARVDREGDFSRRVATYVLDNHIDGDSGLGNGLKQFRGDAWSVLHIVHGNAGLAVIEDDLADDDVFHTAESADNFRKVLMFAGAGRGRSLRLGHRQFRSWLRRVELETLVYGSQGLLTEIAINQN